MWTAALVSAVLGTKLPGPGTIYLGQDLRFLKPVTPGDTITATVTVLSKEASKQTVVLDTACSNQRGETVLSGTATVMAPGRRVTWLRLGLPEIVLKHSDRYNSIVAQARALPPLSAAIVHPCSPEAILAAIEIRDEGLLQPILVGPEVKIRPRRRRPAPQSTGSRLNPPRIAMPRPRAPSNSPWRAGWRPL